MTDLHSPSQPGTPEVVVRRRDGSDGGAEVVALADRLEAFCLRVRSRLILDTVLDGSRVWSRTERVEIP